MGPPGYKIPGGTPSDPEARGDPAGVPGATCASRPRAPTTRRRGRSWPRPSRARRSTSTPRSRIESRYFDQPGRRPERQEHDPGVLLRPAGDQLRRRCAPRASTPFTATKVGVLGAGMMGAGIAYVLRPRRHRGRAQGRRARGRREGQGLLREAARQGDRARQDRPRRRATSCSPGSPPTADPADLAGCDLVIEAVFEDPALKAKVFAEIAATSSNPDALLCSNTSTLPITELADGRRPARRTSSACTSSRPVDKMPLVEIITGEQTSDEALAKRLRRRPADQQDADRGQRQPRLLHLARHRHAASTRASRCSPRASTRMSHRAGRHAGRLPGGAAAALRRAEPEADAARSARPPTRPPRATGVELPAHPAEAVIDRMVDEFGRPGKAPGRRLLRVRRATASASGSGRGCASTSPAPTCEIPLRRHPGADAVLEALETVKCFDEGVIESAAAANIGSIMGIGFPPLDGGAVQYMNGYEGPAGPAGLTGFVARARELAAAYGERFDAAGVPRRAGREGRALPRLSRSPPDSPSHAVRAQVPSPERRCRAVVRPGRRTSRHRRRRARAADGQHECPRQRPAAHGPAGRPPQRQPSGYAGTHGRPWIGDSPATRRRCRTRRAAGPWSTSTALWVRFGAVDAVRGIDLQVAPGAATALLGRNGAGKSTTMRVLAGVIPPTDGPRARRRPRRPHRDRSRSSGSPATAPTSAAWCRGPPRGSTSSSPPGCAGCRRLGGPRPRPARALRPRRRRAPGHRRLQPRHGPAACR